MVLGYDVDVSAETVTFEGLELQYPHIALGTSNVYSLEPERPD